MTDSSSFPVDKSQTPSTAPVPAGSKFNTTGDARGERKFSQAFSYGMPFQNTTGFKFSSN